MKINDEWSGHLQSETNQRYAHSTLDGHLQKQDGTIQRVWLEGRISSAPSWIIISDDISDNKRDFIMAFPKEWKTSLLIA